MATVVGDFQKIIFIDYLQSQTITDAYYAAPLDRLDE